MDLQTSFQDGCSTIAAAITSMGVDTAANASPTIMANNISKIKSTMSLITADTKNGKGDHTITRTIDNSQTRYKTILVLLSVSSCRANTSNSYTVNFSVSGGIGLATLYDNSIGLSSGGHTGNHYTRVYSVTNAENIDKLTFTTFIDTPVVNTSESTTADMWRDSGITVLYFGI